MPTIPYFRKTRWGMSLAEVERTETADLVSRTSGTLQYTTTHLGRDCGIEYAFEDDRLVNAGYVFPLAAGADAARLYGNLLMHLIEEFGPPHYDIHVPANHRSHLPENAGEPVPAWKFAGTTQIALLATEPSATVLVQIIYTSLKDEASALHRPALRLLRGGPAA